MAKKTAINVNDELPATLAEAQREYEDLARQCGQFDAQTRKLLAEQAEARLALTRERLAQRQKLLARKGVAHQQVMKLTPKPDPADLAEGAEGAGFDQAQTQAAE